MLAPLAANALILLIFTVAAILFRIDPDLYYRSAQEGTPFEWFTFRGSEPAASEPALESCFD